LLLLMMIIMMLLFTGGVGIEPQSVDGLVAGSSRLQAFSDEVVALLNASLLGSDVLVREVSAPHKTPNSSR